MDVAVAESSLPAAQPIFTDGFGERRCIVDALGERLDVLQLSRVFPAASSAEFAIRQRAARLAGFRHDSFARVRAVELDEPSGALLVVSDHVPGERLSVLLTAAEKARVPLEMGAIRSFIRQLVYGMAAWHAEMPDIAHGAIGPERLVITRDGRVVVADCVLGSALEQLRYSRDQYWKELRVPVPATTGAPSFDARSDVTQIGLVALALILGRPVTTTDPAAIQSALDVASIGAGARAPLSPALRDWILRALQLDPKWSFSSATDARVALDAAGKEHVAAESEVHLGQRIEALRAFLSRYPSRSVEPPSPAKPIPETTPASHDTRDEKEADPEEPAERPLMQRSATPLRSAWRSRAWIAGAVASVVIGLAVGLAMYGFPRSAVTRQPGTLSIVTNPARAAVVVDGEPRGVTPVSIELAPGDHVVELTTETGVRRIPVTIQAGSQLSQYLELPQAVSGVLQIRTDPPAASVTVDGRYVGRSPVSVDDLVPGTHIVVLQHQSASVTERVLVESGKTTSLVVPMATMPVSGAAGWLSVSAPADVQIYEGARLLGTNRIDRIMLPAGRHDVDIVNEELGYRERRTVNVPAGGVAALTPAWPMGTLALNAVPWAEAFVDGTSVGETPLGELRVPVGEHEVVFRHPQLGERQAFVTVVVGRPARIGVDLRAR
jgi:hypothetical protein